MSSDGFSDIVLRQKKDKVVETVYRVCEIYGLKVPTINFEGCPSEKENQLAHYHPDLNKICISKRQLHMQNIRGLERTAIHEVTHILVQDHGLEFKRKRLEMGTKAWVPPRGVVFVSGKTKPKDTSKEKKLRADKIRCNYHLCRKKTQLYQCAYCKQYFCGEHKEPTVVVTLAMIKSESDMRKQTILRKEFDRLDGHACPNYSAIFWDQYRAEESSGSWSRYDYKHEPQVETDQNESDNATKMAKEEYDRLQNETRNAQGYLINPDTGLPYNETAITKPTQQPMTQADKAEPEKAKKTKPRAHKLLEKVKEIFGIED
jgi:hypothetical protein